MACACKVNKQLDYLHKKYGNEIPVSKATRISFKIKEFFKNIWIYLLMLPLLPLMFLHVLFIGLLKKRKTISLKKMLRLKTV